MIDRLDHLVFATPNLYETVEYLERALGVRAAPGGQHPGLGTHNALIGLGPRSYLEIIGPDAQQPEPAGPRWFGIDELHEPRLVTWAAATSDLKLTCERLRNRGLDIGNVRHGQRERSDGTTLSWQLSSPFTVIADGVVPFLIDWGTSPHPAATATPGVSLTHFGATHPDTALVSAYLSVMGLALEVVRADRASLTAELHGPRGYLTLRG